MNEKKQTTEAYNQNAQIIAAKLQTSGVRIQDINITFSHIKKENPFVLEIGCADGRDAKEILKRTKNYLGIDISEKMIELARKNVPQGKFEVADIESYKFPKKIDVILAFASLLHSNETNIKSILKEAHKNLNNNGIFFISLKYGHGKIKKTEHFGTRTFYLYTPENIKEIASDKFNMIYKRVQKLRGQTWFEIILKKT